MVDRVVVTKGGFGFYWSKRHYRGDKLHRDGGLPAVEYLHSKEWWVNGKRHRDGGLPAVEYSDGSKVWCVNGKHHRDGGLPAIEQANGGKVWCVNGKRHRDGGLPAVEHANGAKVWCVNGKRHRDGGLPAVETENGGKEWWVNDIKVTEKQSQFIHEKKMKRVKKIYWKWEYITYKLEKPAHMARLEREMKMDMHYLENEIGYKLN